MASDMEGPTPTSLQPKHSFESLPREVRNLIYEHLLGNMTILVSKPGDFIPALGKEQWKFGIRSHLVIFQVSKRIYDEALTVFYTSCHLMFRTPERLHSFVETFPKYMHLVRRLTLGVQDNYLWMTPPLESYIQPPSLRMNHLTHIYIMVGVEQFRMESMSTAAYVAASLEPLKLLGSRETTVFSVTLHELDEESHLRQLPSSPEGIGWLKAEWEKLMRENPIGQYADKHKTTSMPGSSD